MGQLIQFDQEISARFLYRLYFACFALEATKPQLLQALGGSEAELRHPDKWFDQGAVRNLLAAAQNQIQCPRLFARLGRQMVPNGFSDAGFAANFEGSFAEILNATILEQGIGGRTAPFRLVEGENGDKLVWSSDRPASPELIHICFSVIYHCGAMVADNRFRTVKAAHFAHSRPKNCADTLDGGFARGPVPCYFDRPYSYLEYYPFVLRTAGPCYHSEIKLAAERQRQKCHDRNPAAPNLSVLTYQYLQQLLDKSGLNLAAAAQTFDMAERTMRRKLVTEGRSFREILEEVRKDTCQLYFLEGTRSLSDISRKLGYSELSAFTRAYSSWYGHPPSRDASANAALAA